LRETAPKKCNNLPRSGVRSVSRALIPGASSVPAPKWGFWHEACGKLAGFRVPIPEKPFDFPQVELPS
jgi:hypothetical protein